MDWRGLMVGEGSGGRGVAGGGIAYLALGDCLEVGGLGKRHRFRYVAVCGFRLLVVEGRWDCGGWGGGGNVLSVVDLSWRSGEGAG